MVARRETVRIRPKSTAGAPSSRKPQPDGLAIFTAVDGTLLDPVTFDSGANGRTVARLLAAGIPVIPVTVMTFEEIVPLADTLGLRGPMIVEAGGAIARWIDDNWVIEALGPDPETLLDVVREIEERSGASLLVYSALSTREAARLSGKRGQLLDRSRRRSFSEPFVIETGSEAAVRRAASSLGFTVRRGRRLLHLCRRCDEGEAVLRVRDEVQCATMIGAGSTAIDAELLTRADIPIVIPRDAAGCDPELLAAVPHARIAPSPAVNGWSDAIEAVWRESLDASQRMPRGA